jgi:hypothetical protein
MATFIGDPTIISFRAHEHTTHDFSFLFFFFLEKIKNAHYERTVIEKTDLRRRSLRPSFGRWRWASGAMAPKKEKKAKAPEAPPSDWVPRESSKDFMLCAEGLVVHGRTGVPDAVRGKTLLAQGSFRITYEITQSGHTCAQDMLLGVCDAATWGTAESEGGAAEQIQALFGDDTTRRLATWGRHGHAVAWGYDPRSGRLVSTRDVCKGKYMGATLGNVLVPVNEHTGKPLTSKLPPKSVVVIEVNMLEVEPLGEHADIQRHTYSRALHPLQMRLAKEGVLPPEAVAYPSGKRTMAFSVNGSEFVDAGVALPPAVFPWVMLTWEGDAVTLKSVEKLQAKR